MDKASEEIKNRAKFSTEQLKTLESYYDRYEFIDDNITRHLAEELAVTKRQIRNWFQNKRAAIRRRKFKESGASYPLVKNGHQYSWTPFANNGQNTATSPQQLLSGSQTHDEASGGASPSRSFTGSSPSTSFYASPDSSGCSSYAGSPATSPKHSFRDVGGSPSSSNASQEQSPSWSIESYVASTSFLTPPASYGTPRLSSPSKLSMKSPTYQPSMNNWRLPLSELSLNNSQTESSPDVSPEEEYPSSSFQMYVTPPVAGQDVPALTDIDWTLGFIGDQNQMAKVDDWKDWNGLGDRSGVVVPQMAVAQTEAKTYFNLVTKSMNSSSDIDDAQITSIISDLEVDYVQDQSKVENILNFLKND